MKRFIPLAFPLIFGPVAPALSQEASTRATIYVWATEVNEELSNGVKATASRKTVLENLKFGLMGEVVQTRGEWIYGVEGFYANVGKSGEGSYPVQSGEPSQSSSIDVLADFDTKTTFFNGFIGYRIATSPVFNLYGTAGLRYTIFENELTVDAAGQSYRFKTNDHLTDGTVGFRGRYTINESWSVPFATDVGAGDSDLTWQAYAGLSYRSGQNEFTLGWRHMEWDLGDHELITNISYDGPVIAYSRRF
ncbi:hypothetical protein [Qingshengfaniella alkalisoli]|uniref:Outer membrane protein beta-barrel domain-containing protein n=1 Tax=Qingshengfaniella alkalisoli TaxID=2599296 RepID=A0A5B8IWG7_9RHOB|nr:hypothetical protein [Qingshengfaniella alkalisoli]QDY68878.1 hypothetical protein FPZ52_04020 [Qingshengfaniella alkalisoli]